MFHRVEDMVFDNPVCGFQTVSDWTQRLFGLTCFTLARITFVLSASSDVLRWTDLYVTGRADLPKLMAVLFITLLSFVIVFYGVADIEARTGDTGKAQNPLRYFAPMMAVRAFIVIQAVVVSLHSGSLAVPWTFLVATFYFASCTPLPPKPSWLSRLVPGKTAEAQ